jgi:hypothetical protein
MAYKTYRPLYQRYLGYVFTRNANKALHLTARTGALSRKLLARQVSLAFKGRTLDSFESIVRTIFENKGYGSKPVSKLTLQRKGNWGRK